MKQQVPGILLECCRKEKKKEYSSQLQADEPTLNIQIWKAYTDEVEISFVSPAGTRIGPIQSVLGSQRFRIGETEILLYYGKPSPYNVAQEIYIDMIPVTDYITSGSLADHFESDKGCGRAV